MPGSGVMKCVAPPMPTASSGCPVGSRSSAPSPSRSWKVNTTFAWTQSHFAGKWSDDHSVVGSGRSSDSDLWSSASVACLHPPDSDRPDYGHCALELFDDHGSAHCVVPEAEVLVRARLGERVAGAPTVFVFDDIEDRVREVKAPVRLELDAPRGGMRRRVLGGALIRPRHRRAGGDLQVRRRIDEILDRHSDLWTRRRCCWGRALTRGGYEVEQHHA